MTNRGKERSASGFETITSGLPGVSLIYSDMDIYFNMCVMIRICCDPDLDMASINLIIRN